MVIENMLKMVHNPNKEILQRTTKYDITEENWIFQFAQFVTQQWIERYRKEPRNDLYEKSEISEEENTFNKIVGIFGECIVNGVLDQFQIPHVWANPLYPRGDDTRGNVKWDQLIEGITLEVKTIPPFRKYENLIIDEESNMRCDYVVGVQLFIEEPNTLNSYGADAYQLEHIKRIKFARLVGFLLKDDVEKLECKDHYGKGDCRKKLINALRPMNLFWATFLPYSVNKEYLKLIRDIIAKNTEINCNTDIQP